MDIEHALKTYKFNIEEKDKELVKFVNMREYDVATKEKPLLLTCGLQSCIALIAYEENFAFLAHMNTAGDRSSDFELNDKDDTVRCLKIDDLYNEIIKNKDEINGTINIGLVLGCMPLEKDHISRQVIEKDLLSLFEKLRDNNISAKRIEDINSMSFILDSRNGNIIHDGFENQNRITKIVEEEKQPKSEEKSNNEEVEFC